MSDYGELHREQDTFGKVPETLMHDPQVPDFTVRLYAHMHWRFGANKDNHEGQASMSRYLDVSERTISTHINLLEAADWIVVETRPRHEKSGNWQTPYYHVFESQESCRRWRTRYTAPVAGYEIRPKPTEVSWRTSRRGKGGLTAESCRFVPDGKDARLNPDSGGGLNLDSARGMNPDSDNLDSCDPDSQEPKNSSSAANAGKAATTSTSSSSSQEKAKGAANPTGLMKTKYYPFMEGIVYDDPFNDQAQWERAQKKHGVYPNASLRLGRDLMTASAFQGCRVEQVERRYGYKKPKRSVVPDAETDPLYHEITRLWNLNPASASGRVFQIRHMLAGTAKKGEWGQCALVQPMDVRELRAYDLWRREFAGRDGMNMPEVPAQLQKSIAEFRDSPQYQYCLRRVGADGVGVAAESEPEDRTQIDDGVVRAAKSTQPNYFLEQMPLRLRAQYKQREGLELSDEERAALAS